MDEQPQSQHQTNIPNTNIKSFFSFFLSERLKKWLILFRKICIWLIIIFFGSSIFFTLLFSFINPPASSLMIIRYIKADKEKGEKRIVKKWKKIEDISPYMIQAVVAAEDNNFLNHFGIDLKAVKEAREYNRTHKRKRGASTITQQTAKNLFLWPQRTYIRKGLELYFTVLIELLWSKKRIMEVYLNIIELGNSIYGVEAASKLYFNKTASKLSRSEAALIASILPNPRKRNPSKPTAYLYSRQAHILELMDKTGKVNF